MVLPSPTHSTTIASPGPDSESGSSASWLNTSASTFIPKRVTIKSLDGREVDFGAWRRDALASPIVESNSPSIHQTHQKGTPVVRKEALKAKKKRLAKEKKRSAEEEERRSTEEKEKRSAEKVKVRKAEEEKAAEEKTEDEENVVVTPPSTLATARPIEDLGHHRTSSAAIPPPISRQASTSGFKPTPSGFTLGNFSTPTSKTTREESFAAAMSQRWDTSTPTDPAGLGSNRTRIKRGGSRNQPNEIHAADKSNNEVTEDQVVPKLCRRTIPPLQQIRPQLCKPRHSEFYFGSGNIVFVCGNTSFRVQSDLLSNNSQMFSDMLGPVRLAEGHLSDGCSCVHLPDSAEDFGTLLKVFYTPGYVCPAMCSLFAPR